jgi:hypothetical protein
MKLKFTLTIFLFVNINDQLKLLAKNPGLHRGFVEYLEADLVRIGPYSSGI